MVSVEDYFAALAHAGIFVSEADYARVVALVDEEGAGNIRYSSVVADLRAGIASVDFHFLFACMCIHVLWMYDDTPHHFNMISFGLIQLSAPSFPPMVSLQPPYAVPRSLPSS